MSGYLIFNKAILRKNNNKKKRYYVTPSINVQSGWSGSGLTFDQFRCLFVFGPFYSDEKNLDFEDKIKVDYVKINIINPTSNDQMIQRNYFNNIRGLKEKIDELRNYLKVFFELFSKIKQIVIPFIKSISFEAFLMKT